MSELNPYTFSQPGALDRNPEPMLSDNDTGRVMRGLIDSRGIARIASIVFAGIGLLQLLSILWGSIVTGSFANWTMMPFVGLLYVSLNLILSIGTLVLALSLRRYVHEVNALERMLTVRQAAVAIERQRPIFSMVAILGAVYLLLSMVPYGFMILSQLLGNI